MQVYEMSQNVMETWLCACVHVCMCVRSHLGTGCPGQRSLAGSWGYSGPHTGWLGRHRTYSCLQMAQYKASRRDDTLKKYTQTPVCMCTTKNHAELWPEERGCSLTVLPRYFRDEVVIFLVELYQCCSC